MVLAGDSEFCAITPTVRQLSTNKKTLLNAINFRAREKRSTMTSD